MALPITIPNTFANATTSIPLSQLDNNFSTVVVAINGIGNGAEALANVNITGGAIANVNLSTSNVNITGGNVNITTLTATTGNITTVNATTVDATNLEVTNVKSKNGANAFVITDTTGNVNFDSNTLFVDATNNRVGVGTATPAVPLDVNGDAQFGSTINTGSGVSTGAASIELGGLRTGDGVSLIDLHAVSGGDYATRFIRTGGTNGNFLIDNTGTGSFTLRTSGAGNMVFDTSSTERMRLTSTGRLGINTTAPSTQFQVNSITEWGVNLRAASNTDTFRCMFLTQRAKGSLASPTVPINGTIIGGLEAGAYNGTDYTFGFNGGAAIQIQAEGTWTTTSTPSNITFWTNASGSAGYSQRMIIQADGSIGFKTGSSFTSHFFTYNENGAEINLCDETGTIATLFDQSNNQTRLLELINGSNMFIGTGASNTTGVLQFATQNTERMRIASGGDLLVNTTSTYTNSKVNVSGDINATRFHSYYFTETRTGNTTFYFYGNASQSQGNFNYANFGTGDILEISINATGAANEAGCVWTGWTDGDNVWRTMSSYSQGELGSFTFATGVTSSSGWVSITWNAYAPANSCNFYISIRRINRNSN